MASLRWNAVQMAPWLQQPTISCPCCLAFVGVQVYESKLQELQKQVETISLVAETPDDEELDEEEEEEGMSSLSPTTRFVLHFSAMCVTCLQFYTIMSNSPCYSSTLTTLHK